jgi:NAD-dependent histone deacetylase SIR2
LPAALDDVEDDDLYEILGIALMRELQRRQRLTQYQTIDDVAELLRSRRHILVVTGAGVSYRPTDSVSWLKPVSLDFY